LPETGKTNTGGESGKTAAQDDQWIHHGIRCFSILVLSN
jgi:hypothetical protein